jgi:hypothetical protein
MAPADDPAARRTAHRPGDDNFQKALLRAGTALASRLDELAECQRSLSDLVMARTVRPWTTFEHDAYLRLRRSQTALRQRARRAQRTFDFARRGLRDRDFDQLDK